MLHFLSNDLWIVNDTVIDNVTAVSSTPTKNETMGALVDEDEEFDDENENENENENEDLEDMWTALSPECEEAPTSLVQPVGVSMNLDALDHFVVHSESGMVYGECTDVSKCRE